MLVAESYDVHFFNSYLKAIYNGPAFVWLDSDKIDYLLVLVSIVKPTFFFSFK